MDAEQASTVGTLARVLLGWLVLSIGAAAVWSRAFRGRSSEEADAAPEGSAREESDSSERLPPAA